MRQATTRRAAITSDQGKRIRDPAKASPTAERLVAAARALLTGGGPAALTVQAVAHEADTYPDAVRYHFGGKAGLIAAVVESLGNDQTFRAIARQTGAAPREHLLHELTEADHQLLLDSKSYRDYFALLSHIVLEDELRERVAGQYEGYREMYGQVVGTDDGFDAGELHALASLMVAVIDGLAVQKLLDPEGVRLDVVLPFWEDVLQLVLETRSH